MKYKIPKITVDGILVKEKKVLLIKRKNMPYQNFWALPGGFVEYGETTENAVIREYEEETGINTTIQQLFGVFSDPSRDPRGHTISVVYILTYVSGEVCSGDDAKNAEFFPLNHLPELAFDHQMILKKFKEEHTCFVPNVKR